MQLEFIDFINLITLFLLIFFAIFLITGKEKTKRSNKLLALFFIIQGSCIFNTYTWKFYSFFYHYYPHAFFIGDNLTFLWGPALYLYTKSLTQKNFRLKKTDLLHTVPFVLLALFMSYRYYFYSADIKRGLLDSGLILSPFQDHVKFISFNVLLLGYSLAVLIMIMKYSKELKSTYSSIEKIDLSWVSLIVYGFILIGLTDSTQFIIHITFNYNIGLTKFAYAVVFIITIIVYYNNLKQPEIFIHNSENEKYKSSRLTEEEKNAYLIRLKTYMQNEKPYLIPSLTIDQLAKKLDISNRYLSQIINQSYKMNFYDFINKFRIEEAKQLLKDQAASNKTILSILYEVGFNSKTAFNIAFKKHIGINPTHFKKVSLQKQNLTDLS